MKNVIGSSFQGGLKALAETTRLSIVILLSKNKELSVKKIMEVLGLTQVKASQHLKVLKFQEIVNSRKSGNSTLYSINSERVQALITEFQSIFDNTSDFPFKE